MPEAEVACPKCNSKMEEGFIVDYGQSGIARVASWIQGAPEPAKLFGLKNGYKVAGKLAVPLRTVRCTSCGYVESYAK